MQQESEGVGTIENRADSNPAAHVGGYYYYVMPSDWTAFPQNIPQAVACQTSSDHAQNHVEPEHLHSSVTNHPAQKGHIVVQSQQSPSESSNKPKLMWDEKIKKGLSLHEARLQKYLKAQCISAKNLQGLGTGLKHQEFPHLQARQQVSSLDAHSLADGDGPLIARPSLIHVLNIDPTKAVVPQEKQWQHAVNKQIEEIKPPVEHEVDHMSEASTFAEGVNVAGDDAECFSVLTEEFPPSALEDYLPSDFAEGASKVDPAELKKRLRNLEKKLRQIEALEQRQLSGTALDKDAMEKLSRKAEVLNEIKALCKETSTAVEILERRSASSADPVSPMERVPDGAKETHFHQENPKSPMVMQVETDPVSATDQVHAEPQSCISSTIHEAQESDAKKQLRSLEKKARQIETLEERQRQGIVLNNDATSKIARKAEIKMQIHKLREELGVSSEAEKPCSAPAQGDSSPAVVPFDVTHCRSFLLSFRCLVPEEEIGGLCTAAYPLDSSRVAHKGKLSKVASSHCIIDRSIFGTNAPAATEDNHAAFKPSASGYKIQKPVNHEAEVERMVRGLLNILCPENFDRLLARFQSIKVCDLSELRIVVSLTVEKALEELHYCETYVKLIYCLEDVYPEFSPLPGSRRPQTFITLLKDKIQEVFEFTLPVLQAATTVDEQTHLDFKAKALANMKLIGELFLWKLLPFRIVCEVGMELCHSETEVTEEMLECACMLLQATGHTVENDTSGGDQMINAMLRYLDKARSSCSKRLQIIINNIQDMRSCGWQRKLFREEAKTLDAVEHDAAQAKVVEDMFSTRVMGARPVDITDLNSKKFAFRMARDQSLGTEMREESAQVILSSESHQQVQTEEAKPTVETHEFDREFVKRTLSYFFEEQDAVQLACDWQQARKSAEVHGDSAAAWLLEIGSENRQWDLCAQAVVELTSQELLPLHSLQTALIQSLAGLHDLLTDCPRADRFFAALLAGLLLAVGENFFEQIMQTAMPGHMGEDEDGVREKLLKGILDKLRSLEAFEAVDYMLKNHVAPG